MGHRVNFFNEVEEQQREEFLSNLKQLELQQQPIVLWNEQIDRNVQRLVQKKEILAKLEDDKNQMALKKIIKKIEQYVDKVKNPIYEIVFVGAIKAGKSTLINAILDKDLASTEVTPETAVTTKFKASDNNENFIKVKFYNEKEWKELWKSVEKSESEIFLEEYEGTYTEVEREKWVGREEITIVAESLEQLKLELSKYTSSKSIVHYFVKEVEVNLKDFNLPKRVYFVDTLGLDDVVEYRADMARKYINSANAVIVCVKSDSLRREELFTISEVFKNIKNKPEKVFIVGTQIDNLNNPKEDWEKQKYEWKKYLKGENYYGSQNLAENNLIGASAYIYNTICEIGEITAKEKNNLIYFYNGKIDSIGEPIECFKEDTLSQKFDEIKNWSNIPMLRNMISENFLAEHTKALVDNFKNEYEIIDLEVSRFAEKQIEELENLELKEKIAYQYLADII